MTQADPDQLARIEAKLDTVIAQQAMLIAALGEDEEPEVDATTLDGVATLGKERSPSQLLD